MLVNICACPRFFPKANVNALTDTAVSTVTLGTVDNLELIAVTDEDREYGYDVSYAGQRIGYEILGGVATGGAASALSKAGKTAKLARAGSVALTTMEVAQSGVDVTRGAVSVYNEGGLTMSNSTQILGGTLGLGSHAAAFRQVGKTVDATTDASRAAGRAEDALPTRPPKTVYHQGDLSDGVSGSRRLSTSPDPDLTHYRPDGDLYQFDIPAAKYDEWVLDGSIQTKTDYHLPSGITRPEVRIMPPASAEMNDFLVPTVGG